MAKRNLFLLLLVALLVTNASAISIKPRPFELYQPDGEKISVIISGDQFTRHFETIDGYTLIEDPETGYWCYAVLSEDESSLVSTGVRAGFIGDLSDVPEKHVRLPEEIERAVSRQGYAELQSYAKKTETNDSLSSSGRLKSLSTDFFVYSAETTSGYQYFETPANGLVVLVNFNDQNDLPEPGEPLCRSDVDLVFNGDPRNSNTDLSNLVVNHSLYGSLQSYFSDISMGDFLPVTDVRDYHRLANERSYYELYSSDPNNDDAPACWFDPIEKKSPYPWPGGRVLVEEVISDLSITPSGYSYFIVMYYGSTSSGSDIFPHIGVLNSGTEYALLDLGEKSNPYNSSLNVGTLVQVVGIMGFDWPRYMAGGYYCCMDRGYYWNPVKPSAPLRLLSGWINPTEIIEEKQYTANQDDLLIYKNPDDPNEFFLFENRDYDSSYYLDIQQDEETGEYTIDNYEPYDWDYNLYMQAGAPSGLTIWHVYWDMSLEPGDPNNFYRYVDPSDGNELLSAWRDTGSGNDDYLTNFTSQTIPGTEWFGGMPSDAYFTDISAPGTSMTFNFGLIEPEPAPEGAIKIMRNDEVLKNELGDDIWYDSIADAVGASLDGDTILLAKDNTYKGNFTVRNKEITIRSYDPNEYETNKTLAGYYPEATIIEGYYNKSVVVLEKWHGIAQDLIVTLDGLTITGGNAAEGGLNEKGGGINIFGGAPVIRNCIIKENYAFRSGGGIYIKESRAIVEKCQIYQNSVDNASGGGIFCINEGRDPNDINDFVTLKNNVIHHNSAYWGGGVGNDYDSRAEIINCTIADNEAQIEGGGIDCYYGSAVVVNSIIYGNTVATEENAPQVNLRRGQVQGPATDIYFRYSLIQGLDALVDEYLADAYKNCVDEFSNLGRNNENPLFADPANGNYHLKSEQGRWVSYGSYLQNYDLDTTNSPFKIDLYDFGCFANDWGSMGIQDGDFSGDGQVDLDDMLMFADVYLLEYDSDGFVMDAVTSPCINAGDIDPRYGYDESDPYDELAEHGYRINMGAYGGTDQASKSDVILGEDSYSLAADIAEPDGAGGYNFVADGYVDLWDQLALDDYVVLVGFTAGTDSAVKFDPEFDYDENGTVDTADKDRFDLFDFNHNGWFDNDDYDFFMNSFNWQTPWPSTP